MGSYPMVIWRMRMCLHPSQVIEVGLVEYLETRLGEVHARSQSWDWSGCWELPVFCLLLVGASQRETWSILPATPVYMYIYKNFSFRSGSLSTDWKRAHVTAVLKKGNKSEPSNLGPSRSHTQCTRCKIKENVIVYKSHKPDNHDILTDCQYGYRTRRRCGTQTMALYHDLRLKTCNGNR